jgi:hypothetical protein
MSFERKTPTVFVSSTCYDLKQVRADLKEFFEFTYGFNAILSEFDSFPIDTNIGPIENCLHNVDAYADFFILIIGKRYGYITDKGKSITNLEYLHAKSKNIPLFVFVDKELHSYWTAWKENKNGYYLSLVDNTKIFEFISEIYDTDGQQWVYTFDEAKDIKITMKSQLSLIFSDGLNYRSFISNSENSVLISDLSSNAKRVVIEKPFAWEYKFFAYVLKDEFDKLKKDRWNFKYGFFEFNMKAFCRDELLEILTQKLQEAIKLTDFFSTLINNTIKDALGEIGVPSNLEMLVYVAKQLSSLYQRFISWGLYFKSLHVDEIFNPLLTLLFEMPISTLGKIDEFVDSLYNQITTLPEVDDGEKRNINISCTLDAANTVEINEEIERIRQKLCAGLFE